MNLKYYIFLKINSQKRIALNFSPYKISHIMGSHSQFLCFEQKSCLGRKKQPEMTSINAGLG